MDKRLVLALLLLVACGGDDAGVITVVDAGIPIDGPVDARPDPGIDAPAGCTDLQNTGNFVSEQFVGEAIPEAVGGTVEPGVYHLTRLTFYTGPGGGSGPGDVVAHSTLRFTAGGGAEAHINSDGFLTIWSGTIATEDNVLITDFMCPEMRTEFDPFTATPTELRIYAPQADHGLELIFTRQAPAGP